ncbi:MAG TPA: GNAT family N-acetyltransferase [Flavobacteriales bacterium]
MDILASMINGIYITRADINTLHALRQIAITTFEQAFSKDNTEENLHAYISTAFSLEQLKKELEQPYSEFYFAQLNNAVIGYIKINFTPNESVMEIERIYIKASYHGKGVAQQLMEFALQRAIAQSVSRIWLGVWEHNPRAIRFYEKYDFIPFGHHVFKLGSDEQIDILMQKLLL